MRRAGRQRTLGALTVVTALNAAPALVEAQEHPVPDTYKAVTVNMSPADVELEADVLRWATDEERAAVIDALALEEGVSEALRDLPTLGVVWRSGSPVGHSIKYSHREVDDDGSERITLVTDRRIGFASTAPWTAGDTGAPTELEFAALEMTTGGEGTFSLGAEIRVDAETHTLSLERADRPPLLSDVRKEPKPYWATPD